MHVEGWYPIGRRRPVANRTLEADGRWIHAVVNWAFRYKHKGGAGHLLLWRAQPNRDRGLDVLRWCRRWLSSMACPCGSR